jgi:two-component system sensor histidine kinase PilS (NtrC family)
MAAGDRVNRSETPAGRSELRFLLKVLMAFRVVAFTLFLGVTVVAQAMGTRLLVFAPLEVVYSLIIAVYSATIVLASLFNRVRDETGFARVQIVLDLTLAALIVFVSGAYLSPFAFLFLFPILWAALAMPGRETYWVASASAILYGGIADLAFFRVLLPPLSDEFLALGGISPWDALGQVALNLGAFFAVGFLGLQMARRWRRTELTLSQRTIDLEHLRRLHGMVFDSIGSGIVVLDRGGRIVSINPPAAAALGVNRWSHEGLHAASVFGTIPIGDLCQQASRGAVNRWEQSLVNAAGQERILGLSISRLRDSTEEESGYVVIFQDLTSLRGMEEQLAQAEKLSALGRMAASIAHEIRNPLASMSGSIQLLGQNPSLPAEDRKLMEIVLRETERLNSLVGDFLSYARPPSPQLAEEDLTALADEAVRLLGSTLPDGVVLTTRFPARPVGARVDAAQFRQVLLNLTRNAVEAIAGPGEVTVSIVEQAERAGTPGVAVAVADTGHGIPPEVLPEIFEPFRTTKPHGTGLGLAVVYQLITAHGGTIDVAPRPGGGTVFTVFLPRRRAA